MGSSDSKLSFKRAVEQLGSPGPVEAGDEAVWDQLCQESLSSIHHVFTLLPAEEIRKLREFKLHTIEPTQDIKIPKD